MGLTKHQMINAGYALFSSCLEYYNYMLLIYLIPVWGKEFFPKGNDIFMKGFGIIFLTALTRPIAATLIGNIGDKFGRKRALLICACIMSISCLTIAFLPSYYQIESIAKYGLLTVIVVLCRILQIASAAGKLNGSAIFLIEHFPKHAGLISAIIWFATISGMLIASITDYFCSGNSSWRWAVGIGGLMSFVSFFLVRFLKESNEYIQSQASSENQVHTEIPQPATYWAYIATFCIAAGISGMFYYGTSYIPVLFQKKFAITSIGLCRGWLLALYAIGVLLGGILCDKYSTNYKSKNNILLFILLTIIPLIFHQIPGFISLAFFFEPKLLRDLVLTILIISFQFRVQQNIRRNPKNSKKEFIEKFPIAARILMLPLRIRPNTVISIQAIYDCFYLFILSIQIIGLFYPALFPNYPIISICFTLPQYLHYKISDHIVDYECYGWLAIIFCLGLFLVYLSIVGQHQDIWGNNMLNFIVPFIAIVIILPWYLLYQYSRNNFKFNRTDLVMLAGACIPFLIAYMAITQALKGNLCYQACSLLFTGIFVGPSHKIMNQLFPPNQRYKSVSLCYALATALVGGSSTFVCLKLENLNPRLPAVFMAISAGLGIFGIYAATKSRANHSESDEDHMVIP